MKIVIAPNAFKGSLTAFEAAQAIHEGIRRVFAEAEVTLVEVPLADGGDGTAAVLVQATHGRFIAVDNVLDPLGQPRQSQFGVLGDGVTAVVEMADASGLRLIPGRLNPLAATTYGTGQLIRACLDHGFQKIIVGVGGSATVDGGAGMAQALGAHLLDADDRELPPGGAALARLARIDCSDLDPRLAATDVIVASDVTNPLCGPRGASAVYGPQKGATPEMVAELDAAMAHYAEVLRRDLGVDIANVPGAGAAGGLGAGLLAFLKARLQPGAGMVLQAVDFPRRLDGASLVFTAEGRLDDQTAYGKAPAAVAAAAHARGIPVVILTGSLGPGYEALFAQGIRAVMPLADGPLTLDESMARAAELVSAAAERAMRLIQIGASMPVGSAGT